MQLNHCHWTMQQRAKLQIPICKSRHCNLTIAQEHARQSIPYPTPRNSLPFPVHSQSHSSLWLGNNNPQWPPPNCWMYDHELSNWMWRAVPMAWVRVSTRRWKSHRSSTPWVSSRRRAIRRDNPHHSNRERKARKRSNSTLSRVPLMPALLSYRLRSPWAHWSNCLGVPVGTSVRTRSHKPVRSSASLAPESLLPLLRVCFYLCCYAFFFACHHITRLFFNLLWFVVFPIPRSVLLSLRRFNLEYSSQSHQIVWELANARKEKFKAWTAICYCNEQQ
jgi:hypothetical protein